MPTIAGLLTAPTRPTLLMLPAPKIAGLLMAPKTLHTVALPERPKTHPPSAAMLQLLPQVKSTPKPAPKPELRLLEAPKIAGLLPAPRPSQMKYPPSPYRNPYPDTPLSAWERAGLSDGNPDKARRRPPMPPKKRIDWSAALANFEAKRSKHGATREAVAQLQARMDAELQAHLSTHAQKLASVLQQSPKTFSFEFVKEVIIHG